MPLYQVQQGIYYNSNDINQLVRVLSRPSGDQEVGKYALVGTAYATNAAMGSYVGSLSRGNAPSGSVSIDTADGAPSNCSQPLADALSSSGFRVSTSATGAATSMTCAGNYSIQY